MSGPRVTVVGCLADGTLAPGADPAHLFASACAVYGSQRLLEAARVPPDKRVPWPAPFEMGIERIAEGRDGPVVVLATGDPMHYGVGGTLAACLPADELAVLPAPSAFSLAAARLKWRIENCALVSLHRRPVTALDPHLAPGRRILALTRNGETPAGIAAYLRRRSYGASRLLVLERMGAPDERRSEFTAADAPAAPFAVLNTVAIECVAAAGAPPWLASRAPGLPDEAFAHDGQLTKQEVRAITLAALRPASGETLWDVGAGCGSVAIEWLRAAPDAAAVAFERDPARLALIRENAEKLGASALDIVPGDARATIAGRPAPDAVFLGGAVADEALFAALWQALRPGGRFVANAVTLEAEAATLARRDRLGGALVRIAISHAEPVGALTALKPRMPVLQWRVEKGRAP